jgi:hypothetical protein
MDYFFGFNYNQLKHPEFDSFHAAFIIKVASTGDLASHSPALDPLAMTSISDLMSSG